MTMIDRVSGLRGRGLRGVAGRAGWNLADQAVSSLTNLVLSVLAARALSVDGFGAFAVAFTVYTLLVAASRAMIGRPLTVRFAAAAQERFRTATQAATGAAVLLGIVAGVATSVVGVLLRGDLGWVLVCLGVLMPGLLLQDMWRVVFATEGQPRAAFVNDTVWAVVQLGLVAALIGMDRQSAISLLVAWGSAALLAAVLGAVQFRGRPRVRASVPWVLGQRDLMKYYFASFVTVMGANQLTLLLIAGLGTPADLGALRAAQVVLGPLNILGYALSAFAIPEIARRELTGRRAIRVAAGLSIGLVATYVVWGIALLALPDAVGVALLGDTWETAQSVLPASLLGVVAISAGFGANVLMTALGYAKESFRVNWMLAPGLLVLGIAGLQLGGAVGAALGLSLAQVVVAPAMWWRIIVLMRRRPAESPAGPAPVPADS